MMIFIQGKITPIKLYDINMGNRMHFQVASDCVYWILLGINSFSKSYLCLHILREYCLLATKMIMLF